MPRQPSPKCQAFTLIEISAVLVIMAILAAAVGFSMSAFHAQARKSDVVSRLVDLDRQARSQAAQAGAGVQLVVAATGDQVSCVDAQSQKAVFPPLRLPRGFLIAQVRMVGQKLSGQEVSIPYSARGQAPTYAFLVSTPLPAAGAGKGAIVSVDQAWLLFVGLTGQFIVLKDESDVVQTFQTITPADPKTSGASGASGG